MLKWETETIYKKVLGGKCENKHEENRNLKNIGTISVLGTAKEICGSTNKSNKNRQTPWWT